MLKIYSRQILIAIILLFIPVIFISIGDFNNSVILSIVIIIPPLWGLFLKKRWAPFIIFLYIIIGFYVVLLSFMVQGYNGYGGRLIDYLVIFSMATFLVLLSYLTLNVSRQDFPLKVKQ